MPEKFGNLFKLQMGNTRSKHKNDKNSKDLRRNLSTTSSDEDFFTNVNEEWADDQELKIMKKLINSNSDLFVLNNLMMAIQFFENYDEEIAKIRQTSESEREAEINAQLPPQKHSLVPDVIQEQVSKRVDFIYTRPSLIPSIEPLQPIRIYIAFDNIEVTEQSYASPYSSVNETVTYSMQLKNSKRKGYALLQRLEVNPSKRKTESTRDEAFYSDSDSIYGTTKLSSPIPEKQPPYTRENAYDYQPRLDKKKLPSQPSPKNSSKLSLPQSSSSPAGSTSSGYRSGNYTIDSDSDSYTAPGTSYKTLENDAEIPKSCFTYTTEDKIYGVPKMRKQKLNQKDRLIKGVMHSRVYEVWYLNSYKFMDSFAQLFADKLAGPMGFDPEISSVQGSVIYRDKLEVLDSSNFLKDELFAIVPCIWSSWPEVAHEWLERARGDWPEYEVIKKIREIGCHLIPESFATEKSSNDLMNLEWEIVFPAAEKYLESCLSHAQAQVYIMALVVQKTFFRPIESVIGLNGGHIRNQLFWLIEDDDRPAKWSAGRTGECLLKLLNSLYKAISQDVPTLPDYFIREKNLFQGKIYLLRTQKQLKRIIENPVMYLLHAMQNIRHSKNFFPKLDYSRLLRILTDDVLRLINPHLDPNTEGAVGRAVGNGEYEQTSGFWDTAKQRKERTQIYVKKPVTKKSLITAQTSAEQVVEITVRSAELEPRRLCLLLDLFINHFIKIAESFHFYRVIPQKMVYIEHAERLSVLLLQNSSHRHTARSYLKKLQSLKKHAVNSRSHEDPPETPIRNSDRPIYTASLNDRYSSSTESQSILRTPTTNESFDYSGANLGQSVPRKQVTMAVVHEIDSESDSIEFKESQNDKKVKKNGIVALDTQDAPSLSEDTYI